MCFAPFFWFISVTSELLLYSRGDAVAAHLFLLVFALRFHPIMVSRILPISLSRSPVGPPLLSAGHGCFG